MTWLVLALAMFAAAFIGIAWARRRARREVRVIVPEDLAGRIATATRAFAAALPWQPASDANAPAAAAAIEAALIANERGRALDAAESALAATPDNGATKVWLAWALVANGQPTAALAQLTAVTSTSTSISTPTSSTGGSPPEIKLPAALVSYLRARAEHLQFEHTTGATEAMPPLITTADLAVVTLASGRGAATWLKGTTEVELSAGQARAAIAEHRDITARCLARALDALEAAPGFADAAYLVARLAVKAGLLAQARALFAEAAPRMTGRPEADAFERDRKDLEDPATAVAAAKTPPLPGKAKRSRSLKVL
jgi:thioredoxin-like negative regulator of GroEL